MKLAIAMIVVFLPLPTSASSSVQCLDESGSPVDWYIVYKFPRLKDDRAFTGYRYAVLSSSSPKDWRLSSQSIKDSKSIFAQTINQVYSIKLSTVFYNDQPPTEKNVSSNFAHAKGILAANGKQGFWLIHSVPKFVLFSNNSYEYPKSGGRNGQSAMCISLSVDQLAQVVTQNLLTARPYVYHSSTSSSNSKLDEAIKQLQDRKWRSSESYSDSQLTSLSGIQFRSFYKSPGDHVELYSDIVAPAFGIPLLVETWRKNKGNPLESACKQKNFRVENVHAIKVSFDSNLSGQFSYLDDHSKWAISGFNSKNNQVCIGDINRMESQFKRGGGTTCISVPSVWSAFKTIIAEYECCYL